MNIIPYSCSHTFLTISSRIPDATDHIHYTPIHLPYCVTT